MFDHAMNLFESNLTQFSEHKMTRAIREKAKELKLNNNHDAKKLSDFLLFVFDQQKRLGKINPAKKPLRSELRKTIQQIIDDYYEGCKSSQPRDQKIGRNRLRIKMEKFNQHLSDSVFIYAPFNSEVPRNIVLSSPMRDPKKHDTAFRGDAVRGLTVIPRIAGGGTPVSNLDNLGLDKTLTYLIKRSLAQNDDAKYILTYISFVNSLLANYKIAPQSPIHSTLIEPAAGKQEVKMTFSGEINTLLPQENFAEPLIRKDKKPWMTFFQVMYISCRKTSETSSEWVFTNGPFIVIPCCREFYWKISSLPNMQSYKESELITTILPDSLVSAQMLHNNSVGSYQNDNGASSSHSSQSTPIETTEFSSNFFPPPPVIREKLNPVRRSLFK